MLIFCDKNVELRGTLHSKIIEIDTQVVTI